MTEEFKLMLYAMNGDCGEHIKNQNIKNLHKLAVSQGVWTLVYPNLQNYFDLTEYAGSFLTTVVRAARSSIFNLRIISMLRENGLQAVLLKGADIARLYPNPEYRVSGDTDILIRPGDESKVSSFLENHGYSVSPRSKNDHHFKAVHPAGGLMEVHVRLYSRNTQKYILGDEQLYNEPYVKAKIEGYEVLTLGINDGLMYLTAHYIKHLVNEGGGVRQMLDLLLYMRRYNDEIDWERYNEVLKKLKYDVIIDVIKTIGAQYWGFDYPVKYPEFAEMLLNDSEEGGIFGYMTQTRIGFYDEYCRLRSGALSYGIAKAVNAERNIFNRLFPGKEFLISQGYSYAKHSFLVPFAWCANLAGAFKRRMNRDKFDNSNDKRMDMLRSFNMIK